MARPAYPPAARGPDVDVLHGRAVPDPYRWLEDPSDPATRAWSAAQDRLAAAYLDPLPGRQRWRARVAALLGTGVVTPPVWRGERQFVLRREPGQEHAVLLVRDGAGERVLVDPSGLDPTGTTTLDAWQPDKEGRQVAYQLSEGGREESVLRVLDVASGTVVDGPIDRARYSPVAWLPGGAAFYYVRRLAPELVPELVPADERQFHRRVWLHRVGSPPQDDVLVFGDGRDMASFFGLSVSHDGRWLTVSAAVGTAPRADVWLADLAGPGALAAPVLRPVLVGQDARAGLHVGRDGRLYVHTDLGAPRGRLAVAEPGRPEPQHWVDLVPEDPQAVLEGFAILDGPGDPGSWALLVSRTRHAVAEVTRHDLTSGARQADLPLPGLGAVGHLHERPEGGHEAWFSYTDHVTAPTVHRYDARTGTVTVWEGTPGSVPPPAVDARLVIFASADGTLVRMFVLTPPDGPAGPRPTVLYGYGGFGNPMLPGYSASTLAWVEAGGAYAVACLRGGSEEGEAWHRAGMRGAKQNVFDDLHAAADHLVATGVTRPDLLAISGGSNGGLLVGAALTQAPQRYAAVACSAPLLDMVRYERFGLGALWTDEYGSVQVPQELDWLLGYSPYHRVREGVAYPAVLFTVFDGDTRVDPMHARKMCAALQHATASDRPVLLRREADVGHGARALSRTVGLAADTLVFLAAYTGLVVDAARPEPTPAGPVAAAAVVASPASGPGAR